MLFNSLVYAVFLAVVLVVHHGWDRRRWRSNKLFLLGASWWFYGSWDPRFLALIAISTLVDHVAVRRIQERPAEGRRWLWTSVIVNLGILGAFKYSGFFVSEALEALGALGIDAGSWRLDIVLPVGISFYTFQTMSLTIDAWRGRIRDRLELLDVALYVAFFPQLVAGPIVRAGRLLPQFRRKPRFRVAVHFHGWWLIWLGLFKKVVLADGLAQVVDAYWAGDPGAAPALASWNAAACFGLQIWGDFAGYSDIAIGSAALLGFRLPRNFRRPYLATSFTDFWRRWHISLSTWLRDYLYIPLGGNRGSRVRTLRNLMLTMLLGGLWHGAAWRFLAWGGLHGLLLAVERGLGLRRDPGRPRSVVGDLARTGLVALVVTALWVPFRAPDLPAAVDSLRSMVVAWPTSRLHHLSGQATLLSIAAAMLLAGWLRERGVLPRRGPAALRVVASAVIVYLLFAHSGEPHAFIYFQF